ncbi:SGNH/GDSL hydrolase family protein [Nocardioides rubriscoriae]|uniref:SGNH/GDSL hydrolase family protein n=1 Tax=Nocardioides rubriscoriae TaxID=642762 RepID=UPI0011DF7797|nr:SGNH/GDSL hydrolase family protein [Nocardioides rubriscoriae]
MDLTRLTSLSGPSRRVLAAGAGVLVLALVVTAVAVVRATGGGVDTGVAARCARATARSAEQAAHDTGAGPDVVVIGDSYSVGAGTDPRTSWPHRLPGRVHVEGFSGSGFSEGASPCGAVSYADRAARAVAGRPGALVVVEGGLNDHDESDRDIEQGFARLLGALAGHRVLVVGPPPAPSRAADVPRVDALLARLSHGAGAAYLSMAGADLDYLADDLHPTVLGHHRFGDLVAAAVVPLLGLSAAVGPAGQDRHQVGGPAGAAVRAASPQAPQAVLPGVGRRR